MWGHLKDAVFSTPTAHLAELKARIQQQTLNVTPETLQLVMQHAVSRLLPLAENSGEHIKHILRQFRKIKKKKTF